MGDGRPLDVTGAQQAPPHLSASSLTEYDGSEESHVEIEKSNVLVLVRPLCAVGVCGDGRCIL
jgi:hypothetical protein